MLVPHPLNRSFATTGRQWLDFVASIRAAGRILVPLHVRDLGDGTFQILAGHRRATGARQASGSITEVPCIIHRIDEEEALEFLINENLQRQDLSPVDEARLLAAMRDELSLEAEEIARRVSRTVSWVRTRQLMLDLGDEVLAAVTAADPEDRITLATVEELLRVPEEHRAEAVQLVLHPDFQESPLSAASAREILTKCIIEPRRAEKAWETALPKLLEAWKKRLRKFLGRGQSDGLLLIGVPYLSAATEARYGLPAEDLVPEVEKSSAAPANLTWLHLAIRHGLAVKILPGTGEEDSRALVDARLIRIAESARVEHKEEAWLLTDGKETATPAEKSRTQAALAALEGQGETVYQNDGADEPPDELQPAGTPTLHAWCDLTPVKRLAFWAISSDADPATAPDFVPPWAKDLAYQGHWSAIDSITEWIMALRKKD